jgi:hypothetical protein
MATSTESLRQWNTDHPNQAPTLGVGLLVIALSLWVGFQARSTAAELAKKQLDWQRTAEQFAMLQQQFRLPTSTESAALIAESARMGALGVPSSERVSLMELLVNLSEASGLTDVHVSFVTGDTSFLPPRTIGADPVNRASYGVALEFTGGFAGLVQFVNSLPPSVSLSRLGAARHGEQTAYHIFLSVYELPSVDKAG